MIRTRQIILLISGIILVVSLFLPGFVFAQTTPTPTPASSAGCNIKLGVPIPVVQGTTFMVRDCVADLGDFLSVMYLFLIQLAALAAIIMIIVAGLQFTSSSGDPTAIQAAKDRITNALVGLALLVLASVIIGFLKT